VESHGGSNRRKKRFSALIREGNDPFLSGAFSIPHYLRKKWVFLESFATATAL